MGNTDSAKCQSIYRNLIQARGVAVNQNPAVFVRELEGTARCDEYYDFSSIRAAYKEMIGSDSMRRVVSYDEIKKDERRCEQAVLRYHDWTQRHLVKALNWESWIWYQTVYKVEHTVALFTRAGGVVGGWKFVRSRDSKRTLPAEHGQ